jgi:hypothetical protein
MSLLTFIQNLSTFILGPFGIALITVAIAGTAMGAIIGWVRLVRIFEVLAGGAIALSAAWIVTTFLGG